MLAVRRALKVGGLNLNGNTNLRTPHVDSLARDGARFERFFVQPVCSPTRAEFLTGRWHPRGHVSGVEMPPSWTHVLCRRNGVLARLDQPGPMLRNVAPVPHSALGSCPSPRTIISALAPLSERKKMMVLSSAPIART